MFIPTRSTLVRDIEAAIVRARRSQRYLVLSDLFLAALDTPHDVPIAD